MAAARLEGVRRDDDPSRLIARAHDDHEGEAVLRHLVDFLDAFMWQAHPETLRIVFVTKSVEDLLGPVSSWLGEVGHWSRNIHPDDRDRVIECLVATARDAKDREVEFRAEDADGRPLVLRHAVRLLEPPSGEPELWGVTTDLTGDKSAQEALRATQERYQDLSAQAAELKRRALADPLTGLPNRLLFDDRLGTFLRSAKRTGSSGAVLLIDLDRFKEINDTLGHAAGDTVLREVALRARICLRGQDTPARLGGDEFAMLLPDTDQAGAVRVAERILRALSSEFELEDRSCKIGASIGIALFPAHGGNAIELLGSADVAMYHAKSRGGGYALAGKGDDMPAAPSKPKRRTHGRLRWLLAGMAATLATIVGLTPLATHVTPRRDSASRLTAVATALHDVSSDEVEAAIAGVEAALSEISLKEVAGPDVIAALGRLQRELNSLKPIPVELSGRVIALLTTISHVEQVARLSIESRAPSPVVRTAPTAGGSLTPLPRVESTPVPHELPTPTAVPTVKSPNLP